MRLTLITMLAFFVLQNANAQNNLFSKEFFVNNSNDTLLYQQYFVDNPTTKLPLVIFLHGSGERGNDNQAPTKWGISHWTTPAFSAQYPAFIIAPQCPSNDTWQSSKFETDRTKPYFSKGQPSKPMKLVFELIEKLKTTLPIDTSRIYITGLSMGGYGTVEAISLRPNLFAAALTVCGAGDTSFAAKIKNIPQWYIVGTEDAAVPALHSQNMVAALQKHGGKPGLTLLPEVGHFAWHNAYTDAAVITWLFRQRKK
jgi:predicted peptidase